MAKRANNEGTIYQRKDGRWCAAVTLDAGKRKTVYGTTRRDVAAKLTDALKARQDGVPATSDRLTVAAFAEQWLASVKPSLRPRTHTRYVQLIRLHLLPSLGKLALRKLEPRHLQALYADRLENGGQSSSSVNHLHAVIHRLLEQATRWGLIVVRNPADLVDPPRMRHHEMATLSEDEARSFLAAAVGSRYEALYVLALTTGMRQGELLGLRWRDVDLDAGSVQVRGNLQRTGEGLTIGEPKTARSRRQITLSQAAITALRSHRTAQIEERLQLGPAWHGSELVFANEVGGPSEASNLLRRSFLPLLTKAELPRVRFHDLRHTAATLLLGRGIHPKIVSEMLGHSTIAVTLDLYSHVTPTMQRQASDAFDAMLGS